MSEPILSILIPTLVGRERQLKNLLSKFNQESIDAFPHCDARIEFKKKPVEIFIAKDDRQITIGMKRNNLLVAAQGKYVAFIDDDDIVSDDYIDLLLNAAEADCDCASLKGEITIDGGKPEIFEHSLKYNEWKTNPEGSEIRYERYPNHLSLIRASIAKQFKFPEINHGEDHDWSKQIHESGLLKNEYYIPEIIYYYNYISNK